MSRDPRIVEEISAELGVDPAFVEKDWYSVQVLKTIAEYQSDTVTTIFSGGTSLSKGYGLIKRFSEDLDFRCRYEQENTVSQNRKVRSAYRKKLLTSIEEIELINLDYEQVQAASNYIKFPLSYPQHYQGHSALRPHLEVEFSFTKPRLEPELRQIQSLVAQFTGSAPETNILCLSPIETGSDKLSALTWRVLKRDRNSSNDDPAMIRHLHDLCALSDVIERNRSLFMHTAQSSFDEDQKTGKRKTEEGFYQSMLSAHNQLTTDSVYQAEYNQFVDAMSYADDQDTLGFERAIEHFGKLIELFR